MENATEELWQIRFLTPCVVADNDDVVTNGGPSEIIIEDEDGWPILAGKAITKDKYPKWWSEERKTETYKEQFTKSQRLVAAVNACQGISDDALQPGLMKEMLEILKELETCYPKGALYPNISQTLLEKCRQILNKVES